MKSLKKWRRPLHLIGMICLWFTAFTVNATEDGRYQAFVLQEAGGAGGTVTLMPSVFIIDSRDGHMWIWEKNMPLPGPDGKRGFGTLITYQGKVRPGSKVGEIINHAE